MGKETSEDHKKNVQLGAYGDI